MRTMPLRRFRPTFAILFPSTRSLDIAGFAGIYVVSLLIAVEFGTTFPQHTTIFLIAPLIWLSAHDFRTCEIPDCASLAVLSLGLLHRNGSDLVGYGVGLLMCATILVIFWTIGEIFYRLRGVDGLGMGDAKLIASFVPWTGFLGLWLVIGLASLGGIVFLILAKRRLQQPIPFGPFLAYALFLVVVALPEFK